MPSHEHGPWVQEIAETIRALPGEWDDRRGAEFDHLPSKERAVIQRTRLELLSTVGVLVIDAILDHRWQIHPRAGVLRDRAVGARHSEQTKPYEHGALTFLGTFVNWCCEHGSLLPPNTPSFGPLDCHLIGFQAENVRREDFAKICETIAWLISTTHLPISKPVLIDPIPLVHIVKALGRIAGRSDKLADKMKRRNYPLEKVAGKTHCQRADAIAMFPRFKDRLEEI